MILKIGTGGPTDSCNWKLYGNIIDIEYGYSYNTSVLIRFVDKENGFKFLRKYNKDEEVFFTPDVINIDWKITNRMFEINPSDIFVDWACAKMKDGSEKFFVFDTPAYILNDEGKTIEIIRR